MPADRDAVSRAFAEAFDREGTDRDAYLAAFRADDAEPHVLGGLWRRRG